MMLLRMNTTPKMFAPQKAEDVAKAMSEGDEDWVYKADHDPKGTGYSRVAAYDEDGELIGYI